MRLQTKKVVAREFLLLVIPLLVFLVTTFVTGLMFTSRIESLTFQAANNDEKIENMLDSVKAAEQAEFEGIVARMKKDNVAEADISNVKAYFYSKKYGAVDEFGIPIKAFEKVVAYRELINEQINQLEGKRSQVMGYNGSDGIIGALYLLVLIIIYPVRLLFLSIVWSIRVLKSRDIQ